MVDDNKRDYYIRKRTQNRKVYKKNRLSRKKDKRVTCIGHIQQIDSEAFILERLSIGKIQIPHMRILRTSLRNPDVFDILWKHDKVKIKGVVKQYIRRNGSVSYSLKNIDYLSVLESKNTLGVIQ